MLLRYDMAYWVIFFPAIILVGLRTSLTDLTRMRVENRLIVVGLSYAVCIYGLFLLAQIWTGSSGTSNSFWGDRVQAVLWGFDRWCINLLISLVVAFLFWRGRVWGAGDAKLFIVYAALMPLGQYGRVYFHYYFSSFWLLLCIFIPAALFYLASFVWHYIKMLMTNGVGNFFQAAFTICVQCLRTTWRQDISFSGTIFLGFLLLVPHLKGRISSEWMLLLMMSISLVRLQILELIKHKILFSILIAVGVGYAAYLLLTGSLSWQSVGQSATFFSVFFLVNKFIDAHAGQLVDPKASFAPWMILGVLLAWFF